MKETLSHYVKLACSILSRQLGYYDDEAGQAVDRTSQGPVSA